MRECVRHMIYGRGTKACNPFNCTRSLLLFSNNCQELRVESSIFTTEMIGLYFINKLFANFILINTVVESQTGKLSTSAYLFKAK